MSGNLWMGTASNRENVEMEDIRLKQPHRGLYGQTAAPNPTPLPGPSIHLTQLCLPGLESMVGIDQIFVHQEANLSEIFSNVPNDFEVLSSSGQRLFKIVEATGQTARTLGGGHQNFEMQFLDSSGNEVLRLQGQPGFYGGRACVAVYYVNGGLEQKIGEVVQDRSGCQLEYSVRDAFGNSMLRIQGPKFGDFCCGLLMVGSVAFPVVSLDKKTIVGGIGKLWGGIIREIFTMADNYGVQFPIDLDVTTKCLLVGAAIMLDFQFFERQ